MRPVPALAVVGHPNKGKSSVVATLAESNEIAISATAGTTTRASRWTLQVDGDPCYELFDTPGFQRPRHVLKWLQDHSEDAGDRPATVARFVAENSSNSRFADECELLGPLVQGAGILYVVDGSQPYSAEYETEMEILRWTGRPRMALINLIGAGDHVDDWRRALDQYFAIVRVFDAHAATFDQRIGLLRAFAELDERWRQPLAQASSALIQQRKQRRSAAAAEITALLVDALTASREREIAQHAATAPVHEALRQELEDFLRTREQQARGRIESIWAHAGVERFESEPPELNIELFSEESFQLFGLSRAQLLSTGAAAGAATGLGFDVLLGGASLLLGAAIGAAVGAAGSWWGAERIASQTVLGQQVGRTALRVGPVTNPAFVWVVLGRALFHFMLLAQRTHATRTPLVLEEAAGSVRDLGDAERRHLETLFSKIRNAGTADEGARGALQQAIGALLDHADSHSGPVPRDLRASS